MKPAPTPTRLPARLALLVLGMWSLAAPLHAAIDYTINEGVWRMLYGVTVAQMADPAWRAADDDGDGRTNGSELPAGTDPFKAASALTITTVTRSGANILVTFPTERGKQYNAQKSASLLPPAWLAYSPAIIVMGDGTPKTLTVPMSAAPYFRVLVQDRDLDLDDVSEWAELAAGYDPTNPNTNGSPTADRAALLAGLASSNVVTIVATDLTATQPADALTPPVDTGRLAVRRSGPLLFSAVKVPLQSLGTAVAGTDYLALPAMVTFGPDQTEVVLNVTPLPNANRTTNVTVIARALAGGGYTVGAAGSAGVVLHPAGNANGTGLTGQYHNASNSNYTTQQTIFASAPEMTRVDATLDFSGIANIATGNPCTITMRAPHGLATGNSVTISGVVGGGFTPGINATFTATVTDALSFTVPSNCTSKPTDLTTASVSGTDGPNGWGSLAGPAGMSPPSTNRAFSVRWTGQILPKYSETYTLSLRSDESAKVWVDGKLLIDKWVSQSATEYFNTIALTAGVRHDIQIDYWNSTGSNPQARLYWYSDSQVKEIVPQNRLFPEPALASKVTAVTSSLDAVGYEGVPFRYSIVTPSIGGSVTYSLAAGSGPLPPGLTLGAATGLVSGTPTAAGTYQVAFNAQNAAASAITGSSVVAFRIFPVGGVSREVLAASGAGLGQIVFPSGIPSHDTIATMDDDTDHPANTGKRLRAYFIPPKTGNYYFWLAGNNAAELWIANDSEYVNRVRRASVDPAGTGKHAWDAQVSQRSPWLHFTAGERYYVEVLHNTGPGADDFVAVGWCQDDLGAVPAVPDAPNPNGTPPQILNGGAVLQGFPLSGIMPGYVFQPYDYPTTVLPTGTLYACNLGPQGAAATFAGGSSSLRVNAAGTQATLKFDYQGLTAPRTAYHLHVDAFDTHPQGEIVYDIDDIDSFHPDLRTADGSYIWNFAPGGTFPTAASLFDAIQRGKVYLNIHSAAYPAGEIRGTYALVQGSQTPPSPAAYAAPSYPDDHTTDAGAVRFLNQATFGASPADIASVKATGFSAWIDSQIALPNTSISADVFATLPSGTGIYSISAFHGNWWKHAITSPDQLRRRLAFALSEIVVVSWQDASGPIRSNGGLFADYCDMLATYCLPTPGVPESGTFAGLLKAGTLHPAMGLYLDMRANDKANPAIGRHPNENYAREILQLFSVGLYRLWDDGQRMLDSDGGLIPTYTQEEVLGFAATFTGWNYHQPLQASGRLPADWSNVVDYDNPMMLTPSRHEPGAKLLLNREMLPAATGLTPRVAIASVLAGNPCTVNTTTAHGLRTGDTVALSGITGGAFAPVINGAHPVTVVSATAFLVPVDCSSTAGLAYPTATATGATITPATYGTTGLPAISGSQADSVGTSLPHPYDQYGLTDLDRAIENIVRNDSVAPYVCRQLIQRFTDSSPSPGYLYRVVQKFRNNGSGVRGDLAAVVRQILMDGEARNSAAAFASSDFGKQREPILRVTGLARAFPAPSYTATYAQMSGVDSHKLRLITTTPNALSTNIEVNLNFDGNFTATNPPTPSGNPTTGTYYITAPLLVAGVATGNPATVTTQSPHHLVNGDSVTIASVSGSGATPTINATYPVTVTGASTFTIPVNCTVASTPGTGSITGGRTIEVAATGLSNVGYAQNAGSNVLTVNMAGPPTDARVTGSMAQIASFTAGNPCTITTAAAHGLATGQRVIVSSVAGGAFSPGINDVPYTVTVLDVTRFTVPVSCTNAAVTAPGNFEKTAKSRVYLHFLTQTAAGGAGLPASGVRDVETNATATTFTVLTPDTPAAARAGNVLIPNFLTDYVVRTTGGPARVEITMVAVNHNLQVGDHFWVDSPPSPATQLKDAEYVVGATTAPRRMDGVWPPAYPAGTYLATPIVASGFDERVWPLVPPPLGRSGAVAIRGSTYDLTSTDPVINQTPLNAPSVFNFFYADYKFPGALANAGLDSPEFQLSSDAEIMRLSNSVTNMLIGVNNTNAHGLASFVNGDDAVLFNFGEFMTAAQTANAGIPALIDKIANRLVGGPLTPGVKAEIQSFVTNATYFPLTAPTPTNAQMRDRVRAIVHAIAVSGDYAVQR